VANPIPPKERGIILTPLGSSDISCSSRKPCRGIGKDLLHFNGCKKKKRKVNWEKRRKKMENHNGHFTFEAITVTVTVTVTESPSVPELISKCASCLTVALLDFVQVSIEFRGYGESLEIKREKRRSNAKWISF